MGPASLAFPGLPQEGAVRKSTRSNLEIFYRYPHPRYPSDFSPQQQQYDGGQYVADGILFWG
ncbi:MAG: hypothetical protein HC919_01465 [Oscillatoriales cyanobacterium SM2_2_1]|nr:hypothetical protein [Oscillatoriales cyanobacterium SM2_2_1]